RRAATRPAGAAAWPGHGDARRDAGRVRPELGCPGTLQPGDRADRGSALGHAHRDSLDVYDTTGYVTRRQDDLSLSSCHLVILSETALMTLKLPIFPLNTVLFPGASIQLHIFEERYRLMIGRCLEQSSPFGVALIRSGSEVSPDDPWVRRQLELGEATDELELGALKRELGG